MIDGGAAARGEQDRLLRRMVGMRVTEVGLRAGSFLIIDLVDPPERAVGPFNDGVLWIYMAAWRLDEARRPVVGHEDARPGIRAAASSLTGRVLTDVRDDADHLDVVFHFDDVSIKVFPTDFGAGGSVHWAMWSPSGRVLIAGPGARRTVEESARSQLTAQLTYMRDQESPDGPR